MFLRFFFGDDLGFVLFLRFGFGFGFGLLFFREAGLSRREILRA